MLHSTYRKLNKLEYMSITTISFAIAERPRDALRQLTSCQILHSCMWKKHRLNVGEWPWISLEFIVCVWDTQFNCSKITSQNGPKLAIWDQRSKKFWGGDFSFPHDLLPPFTALGTFGSLFLALVMIRPPLFKPWIHPRVVCHTVAFTAAHNLP